MSVKLRVVFEKGEAIRYVGHLDILRTFVRAMRRADIPLKYSEGFNPHAQMTFILPMGVGTTSICEIVDIVLKEEMPINDFIFSVNSVMPLGGIRVISAEYTNEKMPLIEKAEYITEVICDGNVNKVELEKAMNLPEILVDKKSKRSVNQINIMEHIFEKEIVSCNEEVAVIKYLISAGNTFNVKPTLVVSALASVCETFNPVTVKPCRTKFIFEE